MRIRFEMTFISGFPPFMGAPVPVTWQAWKGYLSRCLRIDSFLRRPLNLSAMLVYVFEYSEFCIESAFLSASELLLSHKYCKHSGFTCESGIVISATVPSGLSTIISHGFITLKPNIFIEAIFIASIRVCISVLIEFPLESRPVVAVIYCSLRYPIIALTSPRVFNCRRPPFSKQAI